MKKFHPERRREPLTGRFIKAAALPGAARDPDTLPMMSAVLMKSMARSIVTIHSLMGPSRIQIIHPRTPMHKRGRADERLE